jgi:hypothetical protein
MRRKKITALSGLAAAVLGSLVFAQTWRPGPRPMDRTPLRRTEPAAVALLAPDGRAMKPGGAGGDPWSLFDGDPRTGLTGSDRAPVKVRLELDRPRTVSAVGVFGAAGGHLSVSTERDGDWVPLAETELDPAARGWRRVEVETPAVTGALLLEWQPASIGAVLPEVEIWSSGSAARSLQPGKDALAGTAEAARIVSARPAARTFGGADTAETADEASAEPSLRAQAEASTFRFRLDRDPASARRAFLVYELDGLPGWPAAIRAVNGLPPQGGFAAQPAGSAGLQIEEINPRWLHRGPNQVRFFPVAREELAETGVTGLRALAHAIPEGAEILPYTVRNLRVVLVDDDGHPLATDTAAAAPYPSPLAATLVDGDEATGWDGRDDPAAGVSQAVDLPLTHAAQPWAFDITTAGRPAGELAVEGVLRGGATEPLARFALAPLAPGRHRLRLEEDLPAVTALRLTWHGAPTAPTTEAGRIAEIDLLASPAAEARPQPRLELTLPDRKMGEMEAGACLRGFADAGPAALLLDGQPVAGSLARDGGFEVFVPRPADAATWTVGLELVYPDGSRLFRPVQLGDGTEGNGDHSGDDDSAEAKAGPGQGKSLAVGRARLDVPGDALGQKANLSMRALGKGELPALDSGMTNVTSGQGGFRLGPHGQRFKKPVQLTLPYDPELIPEGLDQSDIRTYYFDEQAGRWAPIPRVDAKAGGNVIVSATDHFTDFINATLTLPDEPSGTSLSPNSVRELGSADPASGITLIDEPAGGPMGSAALDFPLDLPPGRQGLDPDLAITYDSDGGNGWLGEGWDLQIPSIEVSTLFGVPRYDAGTETETYVLNGEQLAPVANPASPRAADRVFTQRSEGEFRRIVRKGTSPDAYSWEVTDKEGTRYLYGATPQARLRDVREPRNVFRWYLEKVIDLHGNTVEYTYTTDASAPSAPETIGEPWTEVYPERIDYTGGSGPAFYQVRFTLDAGDRPDKSSSGLPGFKTFIRHRLSRIDVLAGGDLVRRYDPRLPRRGLPQEPAGGDRGQGGGR